MSVEVNPQKKKSVSRALLNSYIDKRIKSIEKQNLDAAMFLSSELKSQKDVMERQKNLRQKYIPQMKISSARFSEIFTEIKETNKRLIKTSDKTFFEKVWEFLNRPIITFKD